MSTELSSLRHLAVVTNVSLAYVSLGLLISLQPPFFPSEAEAKGASPAAYGFVFGIANLSLFLFSPLVGKYGSDIGVKFCYNTGALMQGLSGFLFAFLAFFDNAVAFIVGAYVLRFLEGLGTAMAWSSIIGILMRIFPNQVATVMSWTQTCFGLGYMLGPALGAAIYSVGGFMLPFLVVGGASTFLSAMLIFTIPNVRTDTDNQIQRRSLSLSAILSSPGLLLPFVDLFFTLCGTGMIESMLEPHIRTAGADNFNIGIAFLVFGCSYMLGNLILGWATDRCAEQALISLLGNVAFMLAFVFLGPLPMLRLEPTVQLIQCMMILAGIAYSANVVASFGRAQRRVLEMGYADDISTHVMITGVWMSAFALGNFVGPTGAGFIVESYGFQVTTSIFCIVYALLAVVDSLVVGKSYCSINSHRDGYANIE